MVTPKDNDAPLTKAEIDARREAGLKKLLATPPKHHEPLKAAKAKPKAKKPAR